jgi:hypothetical protein
MRRDGFVWLPQVLHSEAEVVQGVGFAWRAAQAAGCLQAGLRSCKAVIWFPSSAEVLGQVERQVKGEFVLACVGGQYEILALAAWKTASKDRVKFEPQSRIRNRKSSNRSPRLRARLRPAAQSTRR